jgi:phosphonopyruvate decarboxylase
MISPKKLYDLLQKHHIFFYTGVPDSLLKNLCAYITDHADEKHHVIAANEGGAVGLAAGHYLATGEIPVVYMQNSGIGNVVNPLLSLTDDAVYRIPVLLIIGWRGEPGVHDEPQHVKQGQLTLPLLETMGIKHSILATDEAELPHQVKEAVDYMQSTGKAYALVVRKGTFDTYKLKKNQASPYPIARETALQAITDALPQEAVIVSTTGKISRELFEYRESKNQGHKNDFLTVGSMGHASQIALGIAMAQPERPVFCFDGDGAAIMHLGSLGITGQVHPENYTHIVYNNGAHDSVGGQPTIGFQINLPKIAEAAGYRTAISVETEEQLYKTLDVLPRLPKPAFIEIRVKKGSREDLGRPTTTPQENKEALMRFLSSPR